MLHWWHKVTNRFLVSGMGSTPEPDLEGEAGLMGVEAPEGSQEPVMCGPGNRGVGVVQVWDVDADEVCESGDRCWGTFNAPFGNFAEEVGRGCEGPARGGAQGQGGHKVEHSHGLVGGGGGRW